MIRRVSARKTSTRVCVVMLAAMASLLLSSSAPGRGDEALGASDDPCGEAGLLNKVVAVAPQGFSVVESTQYSGQQWNDLFIQGNASDQLSAEAIRSYAQRLGLDLSDLCIVSAVFIDATGAYSEVKAVSAGGAQTGLLDGAPAIFGATPGAMAPTTIPGTNTPAVSWIDQFGQPFQALETDGAVWIARQGDQVLANVIAALTAPPAPG